MTKTSFHVLFETAAGYALFSILETEEIGMLSASVQEAMADLSVLQRFVKLRAFQTFSSAENALANITAISQHSMTPDLQNFLDLNLVQQKKFKALQLGVASPTLATSIQQTLGIACRSDSSIADLTRALRNHFEAIIKGLDGGNLSRAQLGLGHAYSRSMVKFNPNKSDVMSVNAVSCLDQLEKDNNSNLMKVCEWYAFHFPELKRILSSFGITDMFVYSRLAAVIGDRITLRRIVAGDDDYERLKQICRDACAVSNDLTLNDNNDNNDDDDDDAKAGLLADAVISGSKSSMGMEISEIDLNQVMSLAKLVNSMSRMRCDMSRYLSDKMNTVAPNLTALVGETIAARLVSKAGNLTNLAKCPASTIQVLGAEKALFRALKARNQAIRKGIPLQAGAPSTPKYGLIFHTSFINRATGSKNKGRISRFLANKCAIASRIDCFSEVEGEDSSVSNLFGQEMKGQVEERLNWLEAGGTAKKLTKKNVDVMRSVVKSLQLASAPTMQADDDDDDDDEERERRRRKKLKKQKQLEQEAAAEEEQQMQVEEEAPVVERKRKRTK